MVKNFRIKVSLYSQIINTSNMMKNLITFISIIILCSCNPNNGEHCAEVEYYNPKTGKHSEYTLKVQVQNGKLTKIYWENGGWLDESHFEAPYISDGTATFEDDRGREFEVELIDDENCD